MILRRLSKHVKDQNWFAVGLDFLIVVIGVFVGLQVSNWNADEKSGQAVRRPKPVVDQAVKARYLERVCTPPEPRVMG